MKSSIALSLAVLALALSIVGIVFWIQADDRNAPADSGHGPGLLEMMGHMQTFTHKLLLSAEAENPELVDFYLHELEEVTEDVVEGVPEYDGHAIGDLVQAMLVPEIERLEDIARRRDWTEMRAGLANLVTSCNSCHVATDHGYIRISQTSDFNPYLQDFSVGR
jgi:hypothetical protein